MLPLEDLCELHALSCDPRCCRIETGLTKVTLLTEPGFLAKNESHSHDPTPIVIPGLTQLVGRWEKDHFLCCVRALKAYLDRTKDFVKVLKSSRLGQMEKQTSEACLF